MSAAEKIAAAIHEVSCGCGEPGYASGAQAEAVLAAIRAMSPAEQAEIIGGEVVDMGEGYSWALGPAIPNEPSHDHSRCCRYLMCAHPMCCGYRGEPKP